LTKITAKIRIVPNASLGVTLAVLESYLSPSTVLQDSGQNVFSKMPQTLAVGIDPLAASLVARNHDAIPITSEWYQT